MMTKAMALKIATETINACDLSSFNEVQLAYISEALATIANMREQLMRPRPSSDEAKVKRKAKTAEARKAIVAEVTPIVMNAMSMEEQTAAEIYNKCAENLPKDWSIPKVQYLLLHELASVVDKREKKGKPNTYRLPA